MLKRKLTPETLFPCVTIAPPFLAPHVSGAIMGAWENSAYAWVVICKNKKFHKLTNVLFGHKIPLGETDQFEPPPALSGPLTAKCDECAKEYSYEPGEVMRFEMELPASFRPHPLFQ